MLNKLRKPGHIHNNQVKKWFTYFLFALIALIFVFFTPIGSQLGGGSGQGVVAYVGKEALRWGEYRTVETAITRERSKELDKKSEKEVSEFQNQIKKSALEQLVQIYVVAKGAEEAGLLVGDEEIRDRIRGIKAFQEKDRFSFSRYNQFLKSRRINPRHFEARLHRELMAINWQKTFFRIVRPNRLEREILSRQGEFEVNIKFVEMDLEASPSFDLDSIIQQKNLPAFSKFLKEKKYKWKTSGAFSPTRSFIPKIGDKEKVLDKIIDHLPYTGLIPKVIKTEGKQYVVEILSFSKKKEFNPDNDFNFMLDFTKPKQLFDAWFSEQRSSLGVRTTEEFFTYLEN